MEEATSLKTTSSGSGATFYTCPNCETTANSPHCPNCGQKRIEGQYDWKDLWQEVTNKLLGLEQGLLHTIVDVMRSPGQMSRAYLAGKRKQYTPPLSFFFFGLAIYMLTLQYTGIEKLTEQATRIGMEKSLGPEIEELSQKEKELLLKPLEVQKNLFQYIKTFNFIMLPFHALGWWLMTRRRFSYSWLEIIVVSLFMKAIILLTQTIIHLPLIVWHDVTLLTWISATTSIFGFVYTLIFAKRFYQLGWGKTFLVFLVGEILGIAAIIIPAFIYGSINAYLALGS